MELQKAIERAYFLLGDTGELEVSFDGKTWTISFIDPLWRENTWVVIGPDPIHCLLKLLRRGGHND